MNKKQEIKLKTQMMGLAQSKRYHEALGIAKKLANALPKDAEVWFGLAQLQVATGDTKAGVEAYYKVASITSHLQIQALEMIIGVCFKGEAFDIALPATKRYAELCPSSAKAQYFCGLAYYKLRRYVEAHKYLKRAEAIDSNHPALLCQLGETCVYVRRFDDALAYFKKSQQANPEHDLSYRSWLFAQNYLFNYSNKKVYEAHRYYGQLLEERFPEKQLDVSNVQNRRIKVGYLSNDFFGHSVAYFFRAIIENHHRDKFEIHCYANVEKTDAVTEELRKQAEYWHDVSSKSAEEIHEVIVKDQLDILVDLVGYAGRGNMEIFARRAAPIQVNYLGYPNTSGLSRMDYRIVDNWTDPEGMTETQHSESLVRLPSTFICYTPDSVAPDVSELPADTRNGHITFGSFNSFQKISKELVEIWAEILKDNENARLIMKTLPLAEEKVRNMLTEEFAELGIDQSRLELFGWSPDIKSHLEYYNKVDIHLDSFPYNGTTTTCQALWQGVPSLTLAGDNHRSRVGCSILKQVGLDNWIATSVDEYKKLANQYANDLNYLRSLRSSLRTKVLESPLMERKDFIANLEQAYAGMLLEHNS